MFRTKTQTHGEVIGSELQESLTHLGAALNEAGRAAAEQLAPRVEAARVAAAPKVAAAMAVTAPAVESAREALVPRVEAAREALVPRVEAAREAAALKSAAAVTAAARAAAELAPRVEAAREAARETLEKDVAPKLGAAQAAALAYATPKVLAVREAVVPALDSARDAITANVESALAELDVRKAELTATTKKARKKAAKRRRELDKKASRTTTSVKRKVGIEKEPRRWPWLVVLLVAGAAGFAILRRRKTESWTPAPAGDGPVPSYREDPVTGSAGKTVSAATTSAGDATPPDTDLGEQTAQMADGSARTPHDPTPGTETGSPDTVEDGTVSPNPQDPKP